MLSVLSLCLALVPQAPDFGTAADGHRPVLARQISHIPIREWVAPSSAAVPPRLGSFLAASGERPEGFLLGNPEERRRLIDQEAIAELVRRFCPVDLDADDVTFEIEGSTLRVGGPPDKVHLVETTVRELTRAMVHPVVVRAELYRIPRPRSFPATATRDQLDGIREGMQLVWTASSSAVAGNLVSLSKDRTTNYVRDVNVEVAQGAKIGDPQTATLFEGVRVAVEPHVLTRSTDIVLLGQFAFGELRGPTELRPTGIKDMPSLDVPSVDCNSGVLSGRIERGGGLVLSMQGDTAGGSNMLLLITADHHGPIDDADLDRGLLPVSALLSRALRATVANVPESQSVDFPLMLARLEQDDRHLGPTDPDTLENLLHHSLGLDRDDGWLTVLGGHVVMKGPDTARRGAERILTGLQDQLLKTVQVEVETTLHGTHFGDSVFPRDGGGDASPAAGSLHRLTFPALAGRPHMVIRGHESTVIRDNDVEIAQKASISDPIVDQVFSGIVVGLYTYPQQQGWGIEAEIDLFDVPPPQRRASETTDGGDLYLPRTGRSRFSHRGPAASGTDLFLGEGPTVRIGEGSHRTRQMLRITAR